MATPQPSAIADLVRELRQQLNLTQARLAAHLRVSTRTINRWENGHSVPSPMALNLLETRLKELKNYSNGELVETSEVFEEVRTQLKNSQRTA
ncbi:MAG: helix-turn-helix transcriptional regulator [Oscillatoriales cyanobacterium C42_A2020_001]|nr:helix-turn-helix transcriptional regulator [Leptolyngbyaceae cyanobacterium C42_A2020_001]